MRVWDLRQENANRGLSITNWAETFDAILDDPQWIDGDSIDLDHGTYPILSAVNVDRPCTITGNRGSVLAVQSGAPQVRVTADDVTLRGFRVDGVGESFVNDSVGIEIVGASASQPVRRTTLYGVAVSNQPKYAVRATYAQGLHVERCDLWDGCYGAVALYSCWDGRIVFNDITGFRSTGTPVSYNGNAYGIKLSRAEADSLITDPRTSRILVHGNTIRDIPTWEGIDTHGGEYLTITDNQIFGCLKGIALVGCQDSTGVAPFAPRWITVSGNTIDSMRDDGGAGSGIALAGGAYSPALVGSAPQYAEGIIVDGNLIRRHGTQSNGNSGGITALYTRGCDISNNNIHEPSPNAVCAYHTNESLVIKGNTVTDVWTETANVTSCGVRIGSAGYNTARIDGQHMVRGVKPGSKVNRRWISIGGDSTNVVHLGTNSGEGPYEYMLYDAGNRAQALLPASPTTDQIRDLLIRNGQAR